MIKHYLLCIAISITSFFIFTKCKSEQIEAEDKCSNGNIIINSLITSQTNCKLTNGEIKVIADGVAPPFEYSLNGAPFQSSSIFQNLAAGNYTITVRDINACIATSKASVTNINGINIDDIIVIDEDLTQNNGSIELKFSGGSPPYLFQIDDSGFQEDSVFNNLAAGDYLIQVKDSSGCSSAQTILVSTNISFSNDVLPIISAKCATSGCHVNGGVNPPLTNYSQISSKASRIKARALELKDMPPSQPLPNESLEALQIWIENGANNN